VSTLALHMAALLEILLKKSIFQGVAKFHSNSLSLFGTLIQLLAPKDAIVSGQRNKIKRADFFNRILDNADSPVLHEKCNYETCARVVLDGNFASIFGWA